MELPRFTWHSKQVTTKGTNCSFCMIHAWPRSVLHSVFPQFVEDVARAHIWRWICVSFPENLLFFHILQYKKSNFLVFLDHC